MGICRRFAIGAGWAAMLCASGGCPNSTPPTMDTKTPPQPDLSVTFHIEPPGIQVASPPQTLTYRVVVDSKGVLNAGVEFETANVKDPVTATVNPARIGETSRETQLVVQFPAGARPDDYDFTLRARLTVAGQGAPTWAPITIPLRVAANETGFSLACAAELAIPTGQARTLTCLTIRQPGFTAVINLSFTNRPGYIMSFPETASVGTDVGGFAFTLARTAAPVATPAFFDLVTVGQSGGLTRQSTTRLFLPAS